VTRGHFCRNTDMLGMQNFKQKYWEHIYATWADWLTFLCSISAWVPLLKPDDQTVLSPGFYPS
jgi:hypothetical protein